MIYVIIILVCVAIGLSNNFKKDPGEHIKAKTVHAIIMALFFFTYSSLYKHIIWLIRYFDLERNLNSVDVGVLSGNMHFFIYLIHLAIVLFILILAYKMIHRKENARRQFCYALPFLALTETFNFYKGWINTKDGLEINQLIIFFIGITIFGFIAIMIIIIYNSKFMKAFFAQQSIKDLINSIKPLEN